MVPNLMKALQLTQLAPNTPPTLQLTSLPIPCVKPGYALVRIYYASIQPSDRLNAQGGFPHASFPIIPGRDYSGVVEDISGISGTDVNSWIGKHVYGTSGARLGFESDGTHAEYCLVPIAALVEKPQSLSHFKAATVGNPFTTALCCLRRAQATAKDVVLVLGANGSVGAAAVQIARAMGCTVLTAMRRSEAGPDIVLPRGAPAATMDAEIPRLTGGLGLDVIIDPVGDLELMSAGIKQLANGGRYVWIAAPRGDVDKTLNFDIFQAYRRNLSLLGFNSGTPSIEDMAASLRSLGEWFETGVLKAQDMSAFEKISLDDAIELGYGDTRKKTMIGFIHESSEGADITTRCLKS